MLGPDLVHLTSEKVKLIREWMKTAQSQQKSYADNWRRELEFEKGDLVFVKVSPSKGIMTFGRKGKLSPWYIGPFEFLDSWVLLLLIGLQYCQICPRFTMSFIYQCFEVWTRPFTCLGLRPDRNKGRFDLYWTTNTNLGSKGQSSSNEDNLFSQSPIAVSFHEEATWEREEEIRERYLQLFNE